MFIRGCREHQVIFSSFVRRGFDWRGQAAPQGFADPRVCRVLGDLTGSHAEEGEEETSREARPRGWVAGSDMDSAEGEAGDVWPQGPG